jgi:TolB protein
MKAMPRRLKPGQSCQVWTFDVRTSSSTLLYETDALLLEAPNWTAMGNALILNGDGVLWRLGVDTPGLEPIIIEGVPPLNNDHVLDPDGTHIFLSAYDDWQLYRAPLKGGAAIKVTGKENPEGLMHFLHGVSPDGRELAFAGLRIDETAETFRMLSADIYTVAADGRGYRQITKGGAPADGPEYSPDGAWLYFNTEAFTGHAQIARMRRDGSETTRLTFSQTVDWFPHLSPDGELAVYLAFPPGTAGHPADLAVELMLVRGGAWERPIRAAALPGGQGTINVNSWSPDSTRFAYIAYPFG